MPASLAIRIHRNGGPEEFRLETVSVADPGPGEALIRHTAIGLNFTDIHHRTGRYPGPGFPLIVGMEAVGVVEAVGPDASGIAAGDRVAYVGLVPGAYCERRLMPAARLVRLPDWLDDEIAAAAFLKGLTAQYLLRGAYPVAAGETVLIHAAAGGVGSIMCQWAKHLGATVIGTTGSPEKAALARRNGCDHVILYSREDVVARVREITEGVGVPVVYDSVGADTFEISLRCLRRRGTLVSFGSASGPIPPFDVFRLNPMGSLYVTSAGLAHYIADRSEMLSRAEELFSVIKSGAVRIAIGRRYPLADAAHAHRDLGDRLTTGSSILIP